MSATALKTTRKVAQRWCLLQIIVLLSLTLACLLWHQVKMAISLFLGGMFCIAPTLFFATWWFSYYRVIAAKRLVRVFYLAELARLLTIGLLFVLAQKFLPICIVACLIGFMVAQVTFWLAPLLQSLKLI